MNSMSWKNLLRPNVVQMTPYSSARHEFTGAASVYLDANENPFNNEWNRYPDPDAYALKLELARIKNIDPSQLFLGNGSDEAIDLLYRAFCTPGEDRVIICPPTYGMYEVSAQLNNIQITRISLTPESFQPDVTTILQSASEAKILWLCSPNNPTGNCISQALLLELCQSFQGLIVVDEAYAEFSNGKSAVSLLPYYEKLIVLQTLSKAWGMAGLRLGMAIGHPELIAVLHKIKPPYNINTLTQSVATRILKDTGKMQEQVGVILHEKEQLSEALATIPMVLKVWPSDANFLLVQFQDADAVFQFLLEQGIVVRNRSKVPMIPNSLRITIGTPAENMELIRALQTFSQGGTA